MKPRPYPGGKMASGAWQRICAAMPSHDRYIEPFLGGGSILYLKRPAPCSIVSDLSEAAIAWHRATPLPGVEYLCCDALDLLRRLAPEMTVRDLVYLDPPYVHATRSKKRIYSHEMDDQQHEALLSLILTLRGRVMLSGYSSSLYASRLGAWHEQRYGVMTRGGRRLESLWCNFEPGVDVWDTRFVGDGYRERERIKRKKQRWASRLAAMPPGERAAIREALDEVAGAGA